MALTINTNIINDADQYLLDAKNVKGTFVVVSDTTALNNLPTATILNGSLAYCQSNSKFYQNNGSTWVQVDIINATELPSTTSSDYKKILYVSSDGSYQLLSIDESLQIDNNILGINFDSTNLVNYVESLFLETYDIVGNITNGTLTGDTQINEGWTATCQLTPTSSSYGYPENIEVENASYTYNNQTGVIALSNAVGDVNITATCPQIYTMTITVTNGTYTVESSYQNLVDKITTSAVIQINPSTDYYYPTALTTASGATIDYDSETGIINVTNPTGNVTIELTCVHRLETPSISISGSTLTIQDVPNAEKYEIYANDTKVGEINA